MDAPWQQHLPQRQKQGREVGCGDSSCSEEASDSGSDSEAEVSVPESRVSSLSGDSQAVFSGAGDVRLSCGSFGGVGADLAWCYMVDRVKLHEMMENGTYRIRGHVEGMHNRGKSQITI